MSVNAIIILCGPEGLSAEADERVRRLGVQDDLELRIEKHPGIEEWSHCIDQYAGQYGGFILSPIILDSRSDRSSLYEALGEASRKGVLVAEVHEQNIFKMDDEVKPLQPADCHIRLVTGLGASGYLLAIESLLHAGGLQ